MPEILWCWRCQMDIPMLNEAEWDLLTALWKRGDTDLKARSVDGAERLTRLRRAFLDAYNQITGFGETNPEAIWHHRAAPYGPPCVSCGRPLRTPRASFCAYCGQRVDEVR